MASNKIVLQHKPKDHNDCPLFKSYPYWDCSIDKCPCKEGECNKVIGLDEILGLDLKGDDGK